MKNQKKKPSKAKNDENTPDLFYGIHAVKELLEQRPDAIEELLIVEGAKGRLNHLAKVGRSQRVLVRYRPRTFFERHLAGKPHQCIAARMRTFTYHAWEELIEKADPAHPLLFLVGVQDPGNMGALIRSAKAFGAKGVLITRRDGCAVSPTVIKASAGAAVDMPVAQVNQIPPFIEALKEKGWWLLGLHPRGENMEQFDLQRPTVFVLGAEGKGLKPSVEKQCDALLGIPMVPGWDSLNVSVSGGIALYEWRRQNPFEGDQEIVFD